MSVMEYTYFGKPRADEERIMSRIKQISSESRPEDKAPSKQKNKNEPSGKERAVRVE